MATIPSRRSKNLRQSAANKIPTERTVLFVRAAFCIRTEPSIRRGLWIQPSTWLIALAACAILPISVRAEDPPSPTAPISITEDSLPDESPPAPEFRASPIIVTATRIEERTFDVPYSVDSLDGSVLMTEKAFRTLPEALREVPGVMVQKTGHGQGSPFIRGFTGFRTLLLIDGVRLNNAVMRDGPNQYWNTVDPLTIERLEIVKGPSSVLYGSDAIGGTVNVLTRRRDPSGVAGELDGGGRLYYRYASGENSHVGRAEGNMAYGQSVGLLGGVSYKDFGTLVAGQGSDQLPNTGYDELDGDFKGVFRVRENLELVVAYQRVQQDSVPRTHSTIYSKSYHGTTVGSDFRRDLDQKRQLGYTQAHWSVEDVDWLSRVSFNISYHLQEETEDRVRANMRQRVQGFEDGTFGTWFQLESPSPVGTLTYGVEYYRDDVDSFFREYNADGSIRNIRPRGPVADDSSYDLLGVYVQDSFRPTERLEIILGGRFTYARARASVVDPDPGNDPAFGPLDEEFDAAVGSLRAMYSIYDSWNLFGGVSQGFRAPNLSDLTRFDASRSGEVEIPAPGLEPENFIAFEFGSKIDLEDLNVQGYASYHYTIIDGMIVRFPTGDTIDGDPVVTKDNVGDGFVQGIELGLSWNFYGGFSTFGNLSWMEGEVDTIVAGVTSREHLSRMQPMQGLIGLRWDSSNRKYYVEGTVTMVDRQDKLSPRDLTDTQRIPPGGTPGWAIFSLRGGIQLRPGLRLFGAIENITNADYRVHGSGQNEPGTNAILGADWRF